MLGCMDAQGILTQNRTITPIQTVLPIVFDEDILNQIERFMSLH